MVYRTIMINTYSHMSWPRPALFLKNVLNIQSVLMLAQLYLLVQLDLNVTFLYFPSITGAVAPTTPLAYPSMPMSSPHSGATIVPTLPVPARHPGATTFLPPHHAPVYYLPTPPVSPSAPLIYPGSSNAFIRLRGLQLGIQPHEVAHFFQGYGVSRMWCV